MKLLELLVKERIKWHPEALCYTQDDDNRVHPYYIKNPIINNGVWVEKGCLLGNGIDITELADDWQTAIVTKDQYDNACKLVDDGYTLWFGGECPVQGDAHVQIILANGKLCEGKAAYISDWAKALIEGKESEYNIIAWRQYRKPETVDCRCGPVPTVIYPAHTFLEKGVQHMKDRAAQRDSAEGERSMAACVNAFNAMFGKDLTETQGWQFMVLLKMARSRNKFNPDDYEDGAAYTGLAGEAHSHE